MKHFVSFILSVHFLSAFVLGSALSVAKQSKSIAGEEYDSLHGTDLIYI